MIPDEAVEAAAKAVWWESEGRPWGHANDEMRAPYLREAKTALEAAAPHLMRAAWDEGWEAHGDWGGPTPNPYAKALAAQERAKQ
jgi:hypothetical protein